jgi:hypothetical protein
MPTLGFRVRCRVNVAFAGGGVRPAAAGSVMDRARAPLDQAQMLRWRNLREVAAPTRSCSTCAGTRVAGPGPTVRVEQEEESVTTLWLEHTSEHSVGHWHRRQMPLV